MSERPLQGRCLRCHKARLACVCETIRSVANRTPVHLLVHPKEWRHPLGTLRFLQLGLQNVRMDVSVYPEPPPDLQDTFLLFPGPGALNAEALVAARPRRIMAIDGTWSQARSIFRKNPWLHALPRCALPLDGQSRYRVRSEPADGYVSTLEAVLSVLTSLEPEHAEAFEGLLDAFDGMQDVQLKFAEDPSPRPRRRNRPPARPIPELLYQAPERVVLVHGRVEGTGAEQGLVTWAAQRLVGPEFFFGVVKDRIERAPDYRRVRMKLSSQDLAAAESAASLEARWQAFLRPDDVLCSWTPGSLRHVHDEGGIFLKAAYCAWRRAHSGSIFEIVRREGLEAEGLGFGGQSGELLGAMRPLVQHMAAEGLKSPAP